MFPSSKERICNNIINEDTPYRKEPKTLETSLNDQNDVLTEKDCVTQQADFENKSSKTKVTIKIKLFFNNLYLGLFDFQEKGNVLKPKIRLVQGKTGKVLKTSKQKKKAERKKKIKKKNKIKKKDEAKAIDGNQDTLSRITQELPKYNWLEEKIKNGESSNPPSTPVSR